MSSMKFSYLSLFNIGKKMYSLHCKRNSWCYYVQYNFYAQHDCTSPILFHLSKASCNPQSKQILLSLFSAALYNMFGFFCPIIKLLGKDSVKF